MKAFTVTYRFGMPDGSEELFELALDRSSLELLGPQPEEPPHWTRLEHKQCPACTLSPSICPHCPMALHLAGIVDRFDHILSYDKVDTDVIRAERTISQRTSAQRGIGSLMGLVIAASGCPHTAFLRPMARFHLPLANEEETMYRATSMYMLAQYFTAKQGKEPDFALAGLLERYETLEKVNAHVIERLRSAAHTDSSINALINLDMYAKAIPYVVEESLEDLRYLFVSYLDS